MNYRIITFAYKLQHPRAFSHSNENRRNKDAQIMLITLIVLMIVAVVISGLVILIQRDTEQVDQNRQYAQISNSAESTAYEYVKSYGTYTFALGNLPSNKCTGPIIDPEYPNDTVYECLESDNKFSSEYVDRIVEIRDTHRVIEKLVPVDQLFTIRLAEDANAWGYLADLSIEWTGSVGMEFTLVYEDTTPGNTGFFTVKDIFDSYGVIDSMVGDNPISNSPANPASLHPHAFDFRTYIPSNSSNSTTIRISDAIPGYNPANPNIKIPRYLLISPRSRLDETTTVSVIPSNVATYPYQTRMFDIIGYESLDERSPVAGYESDVPLIPQVDAIFNYTLLTEGISF